MLIRFIEFENYDPRLNMAIDEAISIFVRKGELLPTFRFYGWNKRAITIGEFQNLEEINQNFCILHDIPVIRRPTGGKGILHNEDVTYSFSCRREERFRGNLFQAYEILSRIFAKAFYLTGIDVEIIREKRNFNRSSVCFARSSFGEICFKNIKIIGSAQKRWTDGFLQQGTIPLTVDRELLSKVFLCNSEDLNNIAGIKELFGEFNIEIFQENIKRVLKEEGFEVVVDCLQKKELVLAEKLLQKKQPA
ncbi:MAG TPA: lipoate--protein ligase family protein [Thermodesulfovibrio thiophilus]|uniref:lipoate--protein ligase family protein n=1 Tax=Thermodesulfovibrio thiophilus TaxID=340095 RepID=UPI00048BAB02|nr:lipoate--protein ligase family protein [Thermodesulfovibrio thiophilus]HOA83241.1 lipoate--protein ligase family protein [Thermodesulfovibrio thiophilus]HQD36557.1 lipoate--protein ligase family protein [Thermodesulfovibrio thiophilus]